MVSRSGIGRAARRPPALPDRRGRELRRAWRSAADVLRARAAARYRRPHRTPAPRRACRHSRRVSRAAASGPSRGGESRFRLRLVRCRYLVEREPRERIPGVVDADEHEEKGSAANAKERRRRRAWDEQSSDEVGHIRDEWQNGVPEPILEHWLVGRLALRSPRDDREIHEAADAGER